MDADTREIFLVLDSRLEEIEDEILNSLHAKVKMDDLARKYLDEPALKEYRNLRKTIFGVNIKN